MVTKSSSYVPLVFLRQILLISLFKQSKQLFQSKGNLLRGF